MYYSSKGISCLYILWILLAAIPMPFTLNNLIPKLMINVCMYVCMYIPAKIRAFVSYQLHCIAVQRILRPPQYVAYQCSRPSAMRSVVTRQLIVILLLLLLLLIIIIIIRVVVDETKGNRLLLTDRDTEERARYRGSSDEQE